MFANVHLCGIIKVILLYLQNCKFQFQLKIKKLRTRCNLSNPHKVKQKHQHLHEDKPQNILHRDLKLLLGRKCHTEYAALTVRESSSTTRRDSWRRMKSISCNKARWGMRQNISIKVKKKRKEKEDESWAYITLRIDTNPPSANIRKTISVSL